LAADIVDGRADACFVFGNRGHDCVGECGKTEPGAETDDDEGGVDLRCGARDGDAGQEQQSEEHRERHRGDERARADLIGELSTRSKEFRVRWAAHNVKFHRTGVKRLHHPVVGDLTLAYEALELPGDIGQRINVYTAEPGSASHEALNLLASWSSTPIKVSAAAEVREGPASDDAPRRR
jgi:hypothetical protein